MTIRMSPDATTRVSPELADLIARVANDPLREEPATLEEVREEIDALDTVEARSERLQVHERTAALDEIDRLIEDYGADTPATDFIDATASEALGRVIRATVDDPAWGGQATLGSVLVALANGISPDLLDEDDLDSSEDTVMLVDELESLIERFGEDAPAEDFIRG